MIRALIWKEWHEYRWKMLILGIILPMAMVCIKFAVGNKPVDHETAVFTVQWVLNFVAIALPLFIAIETVTGERATGGNQTWRTLVALPISPWIICAIKMFWGILTLYVPLLTAVLVAQKLFVNHSNAVPALGINWLSIGGLTTASYLWMIVLGMRRATELGVILSTFILLMASFIALCIGDIFEAQSRWFLINPIYFCGITEGFKEFGNTLFMIRPGVTSFLVIQLFELCFMAVLACWQFEHLARGKSWGSRRAVNNMVRPIVDQHLARMWKPRHAMLWKVWRETRMLALATLGVAIMLGIIFPVLDIINYLRNGGGDRAILCNFGSDVIDHTAGCMIVLSILLAIVIGAVITCTDLQPKVEGFWRSRPINPRDYFWSKYVAGLLILLLTAYLPWIPIYFPLYFHDFMVLWNHNHHAGALYFLFNSLVTQMEMIKLAGVLVLVYTLTVVVGSVLRRLVIVCLLGVALALAIVTPCNIFVDRYNGIDWTLKTVGFAVVIFVLAAVLAKFTERVWVRNWKLEAAGS